MTHSVLIVNGDPAENRRLADLISRLGLDVSISAESGFALRNGPNHRPDLAILDLERPASAGLDVLRRVKETLRAPVIALAEPGAIGIAEAAMAAGASDVIIKPATPERLEIALRNALGMAGPGEDAARSPGARNRLPSFSSVVAISPEMQRALTLAKRASDNELPILLEGEPGAGKALLARTIHQASEAAAGPFVPLHCGGASQPQRNGARHEADKSLTGAWVEARNGVLFVEEIAELALADQDWLAEKLAMQSADPRRESHRVRLICSSSRNLIDRVSKGLFREELYYRINVFPIWLPPLRDRAEDIPALSRHFLGQIMTEMGKPIEEIDDSAMALLQNYAWPGNVRQLENTIFRAVALADSHRLTVAEFPQIAAQTRAQRPGIAPMPGSSGVHRYEGPAMIGGNWPLSRAITFAPAPTSAVLGIPALTEAGEIRRLEDIEADHIRLALGHYRGHITEVARRLGIGRSTLYRKMREFGLTFRHN